METLLTIIFIAIMLLGVLPIAVFMWLCVMITIVDFFKDIREERNGKPMEE